jgi:hypothetical protein
MLVVLLTNDPVVLSFARHVLADNDVAVLLADQHIAAMEGSIGIFPRRLLVAASDIARARTALHDAGLSAYLPDPTP